MFVRFRKTDAGFGMYQNLLASQDWGAKGGLMFFSSGGKSKSLALRLRAGANGPEAQYQAFKSIPQGKWSSVAFVFRRPDVTVYANGKAVSSGKWDHPLAVGGTIQLGGWESDSFGGFIDDFRVWRRALAESDIADLAGDSRYDEIEGYQDDGTGGVRKTVLLDQGGAPLATLECDVASLVMDVFGRVSSLREKSTGRELVTNAVPFAEAVLAGGRRLSVRRAEKRGEGRFALLFGKAGEVVVSARPFSGGWIFSVEDCSLRDVGSFEFCRLRPVCAKWIGSFANAWSDEKSAVCVRSCDIMGSPSGSGVLRVVVKAPFSPKGRSAALAAGPRSGFRDQLKAMIIAAGVPRSDSGGAWSMDSEVARWSYVFTSVRNGDIDAWIDFVKRSGFSNLHINSSWTSCLGHCPVSKTAFPGGLDEMKACAKKIHAAGLHAGMHTLTACINPSDPWITPVCSEDLVADATYTLAAPLEDGASEMVVEEKPIAKHVTVFTYSSNGNVFRIGGELIQYSGIRGDKPPYAFTGLKRGAFGTKRGGTYPAGTKADYLHQRYIAFYPKPSS
ncbi:MAG: LamG domain-containing protein, partial [Kiritimatiellae bacterium]|nr:LamG domain-containing protein [Kiritimatiellia bacterium]